MNVIQRSECQTHHCNSYLQSLLETYHPNFQLRSLLIRPIWGRGPEGSPSHPGNLVENVHQIIQKKKSVETSRKVFDVRVAKRW